VTNARETRGAVRGIRMLERAYNTTSVSIFESDGAHALYCTYDCLCLYTTRRITETQTAYDPQREILRMRANTACVSQSARHYKRPKRNANIKHTYIPLTLYLRKGSRGISDIPLRHPCFTKIN
jgi:hypothetical protein